MRGWTRCIALTLIPAPEDSSNRYVANVSSPPPPNDFGDSRGIRQSQQNPTPFSSIIVKVRIDHSGTWTRRGRMNEEDNQILLRRCKRNAMITWCLALPAIAMSWHVILYSGAVLFPQQHFHNTPVPRNTTMPTHTLGRQLFLSTPSAI